jgi:outer membrane protein
MMNEEIKTVENNINSGLIVGVIALIGVIVLFILYFTDNDEEREVPKSQLVEINESLPPSSIAFVNSEEVLNQYDFVKRLTGDLNNERDKLDKEFAAKQKAYQDDAAYFQEQVQKQTISQQSAEEIYQQLMVRQQELYQLQDQYSAELAQKEMEMNVIILDSIRNYLKRMNISANFDYVLSYNSMGNILLAKDTFDITSQVIQGLNLEYAGKNNEEE